jgi:hypothetical protein
MRKKRQAGAPAVAAVQRGYNTNLASEFYVLSMLYRLGFDANLIGVNTVPLKCHEQLTPGLKRKSQSKC